MKQLKLIFRGVLFFGLLSISIISCSSDLEEEQQEFFDNLDSDDKSTNRHGLRYSRIVKMVGRAIGEKRSIPDFNGDGVTTGLCFDLTLIDVSNNQVIGTATDCLSNITVNADGSIALTGTAFFDFNDGSGSLVTRGLTTVQPTTHGSPDITHITGAIPAADSNDIIEGTRHYKNAKGKIRLSGAVNMHSPNEITFNCMFIIPAKRPSYKAYGTSVLRLKGTGLQRPPSQFEQQQIGVDSTAMCFDINLLDARTDRKVGKGTDCLSDIMVVELNEAGLPRIKLKGTTIYNFYSGTFATQGLTTVQPTTHGSPDVTHITGAIPATDTTQNDFIYGDGYFSNITGSARLSGAVNMSKLDAEGKIDFDCIFVLNYQHDELPTITIK